MKILRLGTVACLAMVLACSDDSTVPQTVAAVDVSPTAILLNPGQTGTLAGTPRDASGNALTDRAVTWTSDDTLVATVDSLGRVTGLVEGVATITAASEGREGSANVTVLPPLVATIQVTPSVVTLVPGDTLRLTAITRDAQDSILTGRAMTWLSNDASVATVDASGLVTGRAPGTAALFAIHGGVSASTEVDVVDASAPRILSITPAELIEGQPATLRGVNFDAITANNTVAVDGILAAVTQATDSTLVIGVPALPCRPRHAAEVTVSVAGSGTRFGHPARPAAFLQLAVGQMMLFQNPAAYCLQFAEEADDEEYLFGVQSTAPNAATVVSVGVTGDADDGVSAASVASEPVLSPALPTPDAPMTFATSWRTREAEVMHGEIEMARGLPRTGVRPARVGPEGIPGNVTVGTQVTLRYPDLESGDSCTNYVALQGTVRYVSASGIWVSDNANPVDGYQDADYAYLGNFFETTIYATQTGYFGLPDDADGNGRVVMVVTKEVNDDGIGGVVPSANVFPQGTCPGSNEGEYFFMFTADPSGQFGLGSIGIGLARSVAPSIIGHELVHNIHISRRYAAGNSFWESWMFEGQATLGEEILGHAVNTRGPGQNYGWSIVRNVPTTADRAWYYDVMRPLFLYFGWSPATGYDPQAPGATRRANAPEACTWLDTPGGTNAGVCAQRGLLVYGVTWSFLRWLSDHYGPDFVGGEAGMHKAWIDGPSSGLESLETLVGEPIEELLAHWAASLYLDDRVAGLDPLLTLPSYDLVDIETNVVPQARLVPHAHAYADFHRSVPVRAGSSAYFLIEGADRPSTAVRVRSSTGGLVDSSVQVWVVRTR